MLLSRLKTFFGFWHRFREGVLSRLDLQMTMRPIRDEIHNLLEIGTLLRHKETRRTCQNIFKVKQALWIFVDQEGGKPTNNAAERALRRGVIWRKHSFGTPSKTGTVFVERILTTVMALRQQKRNVLDYLTSLQGSDVGYSGFFSVTCGVKCFIDSYQFRFSLSGNLQIHSG